MNRRNFVMIAAAAWPLSRVTAASGGTALEAKIVRLNLRHTWTTTMSSSQFRDTLHVSYTRDGITGHGEGAPIVRYHETPRARARRWNRCAGCCWRRIRCSSTK